MRVHPLLIFLFFNLPFQSCETHADHSNQNDQILWYEQAASVWEEALPVGNGRIGAMVFGNPTKERLQLNDDSLWPKDLGWAHPEGTSEDLNEIRRLLFWVKSKK